MKAIHGALAAIMLIIMSQFAVELVSAAWADESPLTIEQKNIDRESALRKISDATLAVLQDQKKSYEDRQATMQRGIASMVDVNWIARFVLGSSWRTASEEQRAQYTKLYGDYLMKMYISNFAQSKERKVSNMRLLGLADTKEDSFVARTEVQLSTSERLNVDYLISERTGRRQINDITIEGISLLATHRTEFTKLASGGGIGNVIAELKQRLDNGEIRLSMNQ